MQDNDKDIKWMSPFIWWTIILMCALMISGIQQYRLKNELEDAQSTIQVMHNEALTAQDKIVEAQFKITTIQQELGIANESLKLETAKTQELNGALSDMTQELQAVQQKIDSMNNKLDVANMTIADLKSNEYELAYMGDFKYTYYCDERYEHLCGYGLGLTASGKPTEVGWTVAADTSVLPMGSIIYVEGIGFREVMDRGGGVTGNHIDILLETHSSCFEQSIVNGGVWVLVKKTS